MDTGARPAGGTGRSLADVVQGPSQGAAAAPREDDGHWSFRVVDKALGIDDVVHAHARSIDEDLEIIRHRVGLMGGLPVQSMLTSDLDFFEGLAICKFLVDEPRAPFWKFVGNRTHRRVVNLIAAEIIKREGEFFRFRPPEGDKAPEGSDLAILPCVGDLDRPSDR